MDDKSVITQRLKVVVDWLRNQGYFKTNKELGKLLGINNESTLSSILSGRKDNKTFVRKLCDLDERINIRYIYDESVPEPLKPQKESAEEKDLKYIEALETLISYKDKEIAQLSAMVVELKSKIARLQRAGEEEA